MEKMEHIGNEFFVIGGAIVLLTELVKFLLKAGKND